MPYDDYQGLFCTLQSRPEPRIHKHIIYSTIGTSCLHYWQGLSSSQSVGSVVLVCIPQITKRAWRTTRCVPDSDRSVSGVLFRTWKTSCPIYLAMSHFNLNLLCRVAASRPIKIKVRIFQLCLGGCQQSSMLPSGFLAASA